ncbi:MAG TPA: preprotein translocase subunit SecG [Candidatus Babeliaceae bacterium]|nr:preprotein translocase subunit SecG [Candidatus Babeliaceae bacterium]
MLYGFLLTFFIILCFFLILMVLIQKGKGSMGLGNLGGSTQMLFGGSGGQDLFQKITWIAGAIFMVASLVLALMKVSSSNVSRYLTGVKTQAHAEHQAQPSDQAKEEGSVKS